MGVKDEDSILVKLGVLGFALLSPVLAAADWLCSPRENPGIRWFLFGGVLGLVLALVS